MVAEDASGMVITGEDEKRIFAGQAMQFFADFESYNVDNIGNRPPAKIQDNPTEARSSAGLWVTVVVLIALAGGGYYAYSNFLEPPHAAASPQSAPPPEVSVSKPLTRELETRLGFLGQFSAVDQVELRAQVGGTLTEIHFRDGDIVRKGDLLFSIDPEPYRIKLAQATAQLETATARLDLANREFNRAQSLTKNAAGTEQNVDQRKSELQIAQASIDDAKAQIRDAQFDLDHCEITAPFIGRIGSHLISVGSLVSGSRAGGASTTLLATMVSLDPIHLDFDMSESDYLAFSKQRARDNRPLADRVQIALSDETAFGRDGVLDFVDNVLDRSSGTMHARATIPNEDLSLVPGQFARVRLTVGKAAPTLLVPDQSVILDQSEHIVLTVGPDGTVIPKKVKPGEIRGGLRVIAEGLAADDKVVVRGVPYAAPGSKVAPKDDNIQYAAEDSGN